MREETKKFTALVLAADRGAGDPVAARASVACKAFAPIGGVPMIMRVLDALEASGMIQATIICGPPESLLPGCPELQERIRTGRVLWLPNLDSPSRSADSGLSHIDPDTPVLLTTADHALLTPDIIRYFLQESVTSGGEAAVGLVRHEDVMTAFPGGKRTVIRLKGGGYCGCNLFAFPKQRGRGLVTFWQQAEQLRKRPWRLVGKVLGYKAILMYLSGQLTLNYGLNAVSTKTGIHIQPVMLPYPQAGVDVDKVEDMLLVESVLSGRQDALS